MTHPSSVYEFGDWLQAHPQITRVKLPTPVYERYLTELALSARITADSHEGYRSPFFTWRFRVAVFTEQAWIHRYTLWPSRKRPAPDATITIAG